MHVLPYSVAVATTSTRFKQDLHDCTFNLVMCLKNFKKKTFDEIAQKCKVLSSACGVLNYIVKFITL